MDSGCNWCDNELFTTYLLYNAHNDRARHGTKPLLIPYNIDETVFANYNWDGNVATFDFNYEHKVQGNLEEISNIG